MDSSESLFPTTFDVIQNTTVPQSAIAFRGYNVENLGRTPELLRDARYREIIEEHLEVASNAAARFLGRDVCLIDFVRSETEPTLQQYGEAAAMIVAVSLAQLRCLEQVHEVAWANAKLLLGYSLGELTALVAGGTLEMAEAFRAPLTLADDCVELAADVQLGVVFTLRSTLEMHEIQRAILETNLDGNGVIGISAVLSPNSILVIGQADTLRRFHERAKTTTEDRVHLRKNPHHWPPMHTPIVWQRNIPSRAAHCMLGMAGGLHPPDPPVLSLVTGKTSYTDINVRETLYRWTDQPQLLWAAVYELMGRDIKTVIHVGPKPNIIPATLKRLSDNVETQTKASLGMRTLARLASGPWLRTLLPQRTALLRAPTLQQCILEDWLLDN